MRAPLAVAAALATAGCVSTVTTRVRLPVDEGWHACVGDRLRALGYRVAATDSPRIRADGFGDRLEVAPVHPAAADSGMAVQVQGSSRTDGRGMRAAIDSLITGCAPIRPTLP